MFLFKMLWNCIPLRSPFNAHEELVQWKRLWAARKPDERPNTVAKALKACDAFMYPNLFILLRIFGTISVTSCECERSGSVLKRLNTYLRASMGQSRRSALALMHIFYEMKINEDEVIDIFAKKKARALEFSNICR